MRQPLLTHSGIERDLIDAAVAVNAAPTLDDAFAALAETALDLSDADALTIVAWDADRRSGVVRAAVGDAVAHRGLRIPADRYTPSESAAAFGYLARKCASSAGIQRAYVSKAASRVRTPEGEGKSVKPTTSTGDPGAAAHA